MTLLFFIIFGCLIPFCLSADFDESYTCDKFETAENLNLTWAGSVEKWYIPLWNKVEYYHLAQLFYGDEKFPYLSQQELDGMCMTYKIGTQSVVFTSPNVYEGSFVSLYPMVDPALDSYGVFYWSTDKRIGDFGLEYLSKSYTIYTDNHKVVVTINQWYDGHKGFTVSSPTPTLDQETLQTVEKYLTSVGFDSQYFIRYSYDKC